MSTETLFQQLKHPNPNLRNQAMWEIAENYDEEIITKLMRALDELDTNYRRAVVKTLGEIGHATVLSPEGVQGLKTALQDPNPVVNIAAVMAMGEIGKPVVDILIEALTETDNPALAVSLVNAIASIGDSRGIDVLQAIINDESADSYVRETANSAFSRLEMMAGFKRGQA